MIKIFVALLSFLLCINPAFADIDNLPSNKAVHTRITDAGSYFSGNNVEAALQELGVGTAGAFWTKSTDQTLLTGDKSGSFDLTTTGTLGAGAITGTSLTGSNLTTGYLPVASTAGLIQNSAGTGFVKVTAGSLSYDNSTYLTSVTAHNLLSTTHGDTTASSVARGDLIVGTGSTPKWDNLAIGTTGKVLSSDGTDVSWQTPATTSPGGSTTQMQYNLSSAFAGASGVNYAETLGTEMLTNGTFTGSASSWSVGSGWAYNTNLVRKQTDGTAALQQTVASMALKPLVAGRRYQLTYTISTWTVGTCTPTCFGTALTARSADGTYTEDFTSTNATGALIFTPSNTARFYIDTVSLKEVGVLTVTGLLTGSDVKIGTTTKQANGAAVTAYMSSNHPNTTTDPVPLLVSGTSQSPMAFTCNGTIVGYGKGDSAGNLAWGATANYIVETGGYGAANEAWRTTSNKRTLFGTSSENGTAKVQITGQEMSKSAVLCSGTTSDACAALEVAECDYFAGCSHTQTCQGTHNACDTYTGAGETVCVTDHGCTWAPEEAAHCENPACYDEPSCIGADNSYCDDPACNGNPTACIDTTGTCTGETGGCTGYPDCQGCTTSGDCTGCGGGWTPNGCASTWHASTNCADVWTPLVSAYCTTPGPHACTETECTASSDGCGWADTGCTGDISNTACSQLPNTVCTATGCVLETSLASYALRNDANALEQTIANDGTNMLFNTSTGIADFSSRISCDSAVVGNDTTTTTGAIRFDGTHFQGYDRSNWKQLDN